MIVDCRLERLISFPRDKTWFINVFLFLWGGTVQLESVDLHGECSGVLVLFLYTSKAVHLSLKSDVRINK